MIRGFCGGLSHAEANQRERGRSTTLLCNESSSWLVYHKKAQETLECPLAYCPETANPPRFSYGFASVHGSLGIYGTMKRYSRIEEIERGLLLGSSYRATDARSRTDTNAACAIIRPATVYR